MRTRTKARQRAVEALFEADQRQVGVDEVLGRNPDVNEYAIKIAKLASSNQTRLDEVINTYSSQWTVDRMPAVDRAIARLAVAELIYEKEVDGAVIISEAIEIAQSLGTEESAKFLNGLLANINSVRDSLSTL